MRTTIDRVTMFSAIRTIIGATTRGLCAGLALPAQAVYVVTLQQVGANVVATGSGSIDYTGLTDVGTISGSAVFPNLGIISVGSGAASAHPLYGGITGPSSFGSGGGTGTSSGT
jgi:hypothetical protein